MYRSFIKPVLGLLVALSSLAILSPVFILVSIMLAICNRGTPFFVQSRPGKSGKIFKVIKFRTMNDRRSSDGILLSDSERLTKIGRIIRSASLDEIPQLLNVIKGDMSLIGPRPLLVEYLPLYNQEQARRHEVRPGITGWAQVNGRNAISWNEKFRLDVWYVDNLSFLLDIKILFLTFLKVFKREGINSSINVTMEFFRGNAK